MDLNWKLTLQTTELLSEDERWRKRVCVPRVSEVLIHTEVVGIFDYSNKI